jgi:hypothetical protein
MADVFLSYKKEERAKAELVVRALEVAEYSVWWDERLTPRGSWDAEIERQIKAAKVVLVLWSSLSAAENSFVRKEAGYALDHGKLIPARIDHCELPLRFRDIQTADLTGWDPRDPTYPEWRRALDWITPLVGREQRYMLPPLSTARGPETTSSLHSSSDLKSETQNKPDLRSPSTFQFEIEDVFSISGRGTVVIGRVQGAPISVGTKVVLSTKKGLVQTTVIGIEATRKQVEVVHVGDAAGLFLKGVDKSSVSRGDLITAAP